MTGPLRREHAESSFAECVSVRRRRPRSRLARSSPPLRMQVSSEETAAAGHDVHDHPPSARTSTLRPSDPSEKVSIRGGRRGRPASSRRTGMVSMPVASGGVAALLPLLYGQSQLGRYGSAAILIPARPYRRSSWPGVPADSTGTATTGRGRPARALDAEPAGPVSKSSVHPSRRPGNQLVSSRKRTSSVAFQRS